MLAPLEQVVLNSGWMGEDSGASAHWQFPIVRFLTQVQRQLKILVRSLTNATSALMMSEPHAATAAREEDHSIAH